MRVGECLAEGIHLCSMFGEQRVLALVRGLPEEVEEPAFLSVNGSTQRTSSRDSRRSVRRASINRAHRRAAKC